MGIFERKVRCSAVNGPDGLKTASAASARRPIRRSAPSRATGSTCPPMRSDLVLRVLSYLCTSLNGSVAAHADRRLPREGSRCSGSLSRCPRLVSARSLAVGGRCRISGALGELIPSSLARRAQRSCGSAHSHRARLLAPAIMEALVRLAERCPCRRLSLVTTHAKPSPSTARLLPWSRSRRTRCRRSCAGDARRTRLARCSARDAALPGASAHLCAR